MANGNRNLSCMKNDELLADTKAVLQRERACTVEFLERLIEIERRNLHLIQSYSSLYSFCVKGLKLSEDQAQRRILCTRAAARFPSVLPMLRSGELSVSGLAKMAKHLTIDNHQELLKEARNKSKRAIERMLAEQFGKETERPKIDPAKDGRWTVRFGMSARGKALLDRARELHPDASVEELFERSLDMFVAASEKRKFKTTDRPRTEPPADAPAGARGISDAVCRAVASRDRCRCAYVSPEGERCAERSGLEFDHIIPVVHGGKSIVDNIRLLCRGHHRLATEQTFGKAFIEAKIAMRAPCPGTVGLPADVLPGLRALGYRRDEASDLVRRVRSQMSSDASAADWIKAVVLTARQAGSLVKDAPLRASNRGYRAAAQLRRTSPCELRRHEDLHEVSERTQRSQRHTYRPPGLRQAQQRKQARDDRRVLEVQRRNNAWP